MGDSNCDEKRRITRRTAPKPIPLDLEAPEVSIEWTEEKVMAVLKVWREIAIPFHSSRLNSTYLDEASFKLEEQNIIVHPGELRAKLHNLMCKYKAEVEKLIKNDVKPQKLWIYLQPINEIYEILKEKGIRLPRCVEQIDENIVETVKKKIIEFYALENAKTNSQIETKEELLNGNEVPFCAAQDFNNKKVARLENIPVNGEKDHLLINGNLGNDLEDDIAATIIQRNIEPSKSTLSKNDSTNFTSPPSELDKDNVKLKKMELGNKKLENSKLGKSKRKAATKRVYKQRKTSSRTKKIPRTKISKNTRSLVSKIVETDKRNNQSVQHKILDEIIRANSLAEKEIKESRRMNKHSFNLEEKRMRLTEFFSEKSLAIQESLLNFMGNRYQNYQNGNT